jgi:diphthine-ammonia ligase
LKIECINPLWGISQLGLLKNLIKHKFKVKIVKVAADGLDDSWIGKIIDEEVIEDLVKLKEKNRINVAGEGGEYESIVVDSPMFKPF